MAHHFEKEQYFEYKGRKSYYALIVTADWQVVLACMIYRWAVREFLNWLHSRKPPQFWFSTDGEESRHARKMVAIPTPPCMTSRNASKVSTTRAR